MRKYVLVVLVMCMFYTQAALYTSNTEPSEYLAQLPKTLQELLTVFIERMSSDTDLEKELESFREQLARNNELRMFTNNPIVLEVIVRSYVQRFGPQAALQELIKAIDRADEPVIRVLLSTDAIALNDYSIERNSEFYTPLGYALLVSPVDTAALATRVLPVLEQFGADIRKTIRKAKS
jgi:hypothetical protein